MNWFFDALSFFATGVGAALTVGVMILMILVWEWRLALVALVLVQMSLATTAVQVFGIPVPWATAHLITTILAALMLAISMVQVSASRSLHQAGNLLLRLIAVGALFFCWRLMQIEIALPVLTTQQTLFLTVLAISAVVVLSLSDSPLFTSIGMLFWMMTMQLIIEIFLPIPGVLVLMGAAQLLIALTGSYLLLADRVPRRATRVIATDITFPDAVAPVLMLDVDDSIETPALPILPSRLLAEPTGERERGTGRSGSDSTPASPPRRG
jgi:hypothetical protein